MATPNTGVLPHDPYLVARRRSRPCWHRRPAFAGQADTAAPPTVILVHGAFADGSSWSKVISTLQDWKLPVVAVQNPLTSLADDVAATRRAIAAAPGKVVLVGHSWGGTVITEAGNDPKVQSLVYVAALHRMQGNLRRNRAKVFRSVRALPDCRKGTAT